FSALAGLVPAALLAQHTLAIHEAVKLHPTEDGALLLLGKSADKVDALKLLEDVPELAASDEDNAIMVRARLGEVAAETALLRAYQAAQDAEERGALALRLGYAATPRLIELLASEIRSAQHYVWNMRSRRSLRVHIVAGLHLAFPTEPVFWKPFFTPNSDAYYEVVEAWLKQHLGTTWPTPRPEFLYEEQAPSGR
ncbi:MAG TPA: hypothetical protein VMF89_34135, partial [Polyangiales bacterium]|nr:hypothetical protein [Polyangiales bacterium]